MEENSCVIYGHDKFIYTSRLRKLVFSDFEELIVKYNVVHFFEGRQNDFCQFAKQVLVDLQSKYPQIKIYNFNMHEKYKKREFVMLPPQEIFNFANIFINNTPQEFMFYSDLYKKLSIIDECDYCYFFLATKNYHSVTRIAYDYAESKNKAIIKLP